MMKKKKLIKNMMQKNGQQFLFFEFTHTKKLFNTTIILFYNTTHTHTKIGNIYFLFAKKYDE